MTQKPSNNTSCMASTLPIRVTATLSKSDYGMIDVEFGQLSTISTAVGAAAKSPTIELGEHLWGVTIYPGGSKADIAGKLSCFLVNATSMNCSPVQPLPYWTETALFTTPIGSTTSQSRLALALAMWTLLP